MRLRRPRLRGLARAAAGLAAALACAGAAPLGAAAEDAPFEERVIPLPGRPVEAWSLRAGGAGAHLAALSIEGAPPDERRHLAVFGPAPDDAGGVARELALDVPGEAVAFDLAPGPDGPLLALLAADRLELRGLSAGAPHALPLAPPLPLPPPTRGLVRLPLLGAWDGGPAAVLPALGGLRLVPLDGRAARELSFPLYAFYLAGDESAGVRPGAVQSFVTWPELAAGDDDGDGRADLFALSRYDVAVYRRGDDGLPPQPSRRVTLRPFSAEEELRFLASSVSLFARDLDGDRLVDLVHHRTFGTLLRSHATTNVWRNGGAGADPAAPPDVRIEGTGGFGSIFLEDLDGDGGVEAIQLLIPFGALQLVRAVLTDAVQAHLRVFPLGTRGAGGTGAAGGAGGATAKPVFADEITLPVETREGRVAGVLPTAAGDFDGDGVRDLVFGESLDRLALRLGVRGARGPGFGGVAARQSMPPADRAVVGDFDGDGRDDVAAWDTRHGRGIVLLRNRGTLARPGELRERPPSEPHELRAPEPPED